MPVAETRRTAADVNNDVEDSAGGTADQLGFGVRLGLVVQAAQRAAPRLYDVEAWTNSVGSPCCRKRLLVKQTSEQAATVGCGLGLDYCGAERRDVAKAHSGRSYDPWFWDRHNKSPAATAVFGLLCHDLVGEIPHE